MSIESQNLLANFDSLPAADQRWVAAEIARRVDATAEAGGEELGGKNRTPAYKLGTEEWIKRFHAWASRQKLRNPNLDDSREAMYEGCGE
jgi:hypothetical protein